MQCLKKGGVHIWVTVEDVDHLKSPREEEAATDQQGYHVAVSDYSICPNHWAIGFPRWNGIARDGAGGEALFKF